MGSWPTSFAIHGRDGDYLDENLHLLQDIINLLYFAFNLSHTTYSWGFWTAKACPISNRSPWKLKCSYIKAGASTVSSCSMVFCICWSCLIHKHHPSKNMNWKFGSIMYQTSRLHIGESTVWDLTESIKNWVRYNTYYLPLLCFASTRPPQPQACLPQPEAWQCQLTNWFVQCGFPTPSQPVFSSSKLHLQVMDLFLMVADTMEPRTD